MSKKFNKIIKKQIIKKEVFPEPEKVEEPIRKRGRPKKIEKAIISESESVYGQQYTQDEEEILRCHLRKTKQIMKIYSAKCLMSNMNMIKKYIDNSYEFGTLSLPFCPSIKIIERQMMQTFK